MIMLQTLGAVDLRRESGIEVRVLLAQPKRLALLIYLTLSPGFRRRDDILALFWPELDEPHARGALRQALRFLRQALGEGVIQVRGEEEVGVSRVLLRCDAVTLEQLGDSGQTAEAAALYRGEFLQGFYIGDAAPELDEWISAQRERLRRLAAEATWQAAEHRAAEGDGPGAESLGRHAADLLPDEESGIIRLMYLLDRLGNRAGALATYDAWQRRLRSSYDVEPSPETVDAARRIRERQPPMTDVSVRKTRVDVNTAGPSLLPGVPSIDRRVGVTLTILVLAAFGGYLAAFSAKSRPPLEADLIAVSPFDVGDSSLALWREGTVDYLTRTLDGAGSLRAVPPTVVVRRWEGRGDRSSARRVARRTGAGLAIYGRLDLAEGDSVRLRATLIDVVEDRLLGEVDRADERDRLDRLQDSAGVDVLRLLGRVPTGGTVLYGSLRTRSIAALKEFLRGEQHYRRSRWDSALAHYGLAARLDTSFALANRRMFQVLGWDPPSAARFDRGHVYLHRAVAANRGLSLKDSLLIQVDSMAAAESGQTFGAEYRYFFATLDTLARRFPDDPEVWQVIGEERFHFGIPPEGGWQAALDAFLKAVELDSALSPAYVHTVELAIRLGDERLARRLARAYLTLAPTDGSVDAIRLASRLLDARTSPAERRRLIESAATVPVLQASLILDHWPDSAESAVALARTLALSATHRDEGAPAYVRDPSARALLLASQLALRGHLSAADSVFAALSLPDLRYARHRLGQGGSWIDIGLLRGPGGASTGKGVRIALEGDIAWYEGGREALAWWNAIGDTAAMMDFADRAGRFARARKTSDTLARPWSLGHAAYLTAVAVGYQLLARGDTAGALERLLALPDSMCIIVSCFHEKLITGRLLAARGRPVEAAALLDAWTGTSSHGALYVLATLERARLAERLGERGLARKRYAFVAAMWARGDSVVRPYVVEAESALVRLGQEVQEVPRAR